MESCLSDVADVSADVSIVLEWENVLLSGNQRCFQMLMQLRKQLSAIQYDAEIIVLFSLDQVDRTRVEAVLQRYLLQGSLNQSAPRLRLEGVHDSHYYELKNEGAIRAKGEVVIFMDSDVVPEDNWLYEISRLFFERSDIDIVAGHTYLSHDSFLEKAFALGWFFPCAMHRIACTRISRIFLLTALHFAATYSCNTAFRKWLRG